jgi:predicted GNAT superfamily acetyltransferase
VGHLRGGQEPGVGKHPGYTVHVTSFDTSESSGAVIRPLVASDIEKVTALNNDAYPAVPVATVEEMAEFVETFDWCMVAELDSDVVGFVMAVEPGKDYDSENYRFFESRGLPHFYIDRVVLGEGARGKGLGKRLYGELFDEARRRGYQRITCEVNLKPENPVSLAFHNTMGFVGVGVQDTKGGEVTVQLLEAVVDGGGYD